MLKETEKYGIVNRLKSSTYSTVSDNQKKLIPIKQLFFKNLRIFNYFIEPSFKK